MIDMINISLHCLRMSCHTFLHKHPSKSGTKCTQSLGNPSWVTNRESSVDVLSLFLCLVLISATWENTLSTSALEWGKAKSDFINRVIIGTQQSYPRIGQCGLCGGQLPPFFFQGHQVSSRFKNIWKFTSMMVEH